MEFLNRMYFMLYAGMYNFFHEEDGAVDIVAVVVLIGIAVVLAVLFRGRIETLLKNLLDSIDQSAADAVKSN